MNSVSSRQFFVCILLTVIGIFDVLEATGYSVKAQAVTEQCTGPDQFRCLSGQCISRDDTCDGKSDCLDQSDETKANCSNITCPKYLFVCDYGACIDASLQCDGVKDCVDNSDEMACSLDHKGN